MAVSPSASRPDTRPERGDARNCWDALGDDAVLQVVEHLLSIDLYNTHWQISRRLGARDATRLCVMTCRRFRDIVLGVDDEKAEGAELWTEVVARRATEVYPYDPAHPRPFTAQRALERLSRLHLRGLRCGDDQMALVSASNLDEPARRAAHNQVERRLKGTVDEGNAPEIYPVTTSTVVNLAAARTDRVAFAAITHCRRKHRGQDGDFDRRTMARYVTGADGLATEDCSLQLSKLQVNLTGDVLRMAASNDGWRVAFTARAGEAEQAYLSLLIWDPESHTCCEVDDVQVSTYDFNECRQNGNWSISDDARAREPDIPLTFWWAEGGAALVVVWSTDHVDPMGRDEHGGAPPQIHSRYCIAVYDLVWEDGCVSTTFREAAGPWWGRAIDASATLDGDTAVLLVRNRPTFLTGGPTAHYEARTHHVQRLHVCNTLHHRAIWRQDGKAHAPGRLDWGPSGVGIAPMGDAIVTVHRTNGATLVEVQSDTGHTAGGGALRTYQPVAIQDVTEWFRVSPQDLDYGSSSMVKLRYRVSFAPCGRLVCITDQRARYREEFDGYAHVVLDIGRRQGRSPPMPCKGLCPCEISVQGLDPFMFGEAARHARSTPMRGLEWTRHGVWVLCCMGLLFIQSPYADTLPEACPAGPSDPQVWLSSC